MSSFKAKKPTKEYFNLQAQYEEKYGIDTVVIMEIGGFYEIFGIETKERTYGQIEKISNITDIQKTKTNKQYPESFDNPFMCGFPNHEHTLNKYIDLLTSNNFTVVLYNQHTNPDKKKTTKIRTLTKIYSPSTFIDGNISSTRNILMCIYVYYKNEDINDICISYIDLSTGFNECLVININKIQLSKIILSISPKEIIIYTNNNILINNFISNIKQNCNCIKIQTDINSVFYKLTYQTEFLKELFRYYGMLSVIEYLGMEKYPSTIVCYILMIQYVKEHDVDILENIYKPKITSDNFVLNITENALTQLNLIDGLFNIINFTHTGMGRRLLKSWLLNPLINTKNIEKRYSEIDKFLLMYGGSTEVSGEKIWKIFDKQLKNIKDIERLHRKIVLKRLQPPEFTDLHISYQNIIQIIKDSTINNVTHLKKDTLTKFQEYITYYNDILLLENIGKFNLNNDFILPIFQKNIYPDLDELDIQLQNEWKQIYELRDKIDENKKTGTIRIEYTNTQGYYLKTTKSKLKSLKMYKEHNFTFDELKDSVKIFSPSIKNISDKIISLQTKINKLNKERFLDFLDDINSRYYNCLKDITNYISHIDCYFSIAKCSDLNFFCRPNINNINNKTSFLSAKQLRHPIIEKVKNDTKYIPNDIEIGSDIKSSGNNINGILLYGLNCSGKSSLLRAIGISVIMAQAGMFVPASSFSYYPFKSIQTKIAIQDNLFKGESMFFSELKCLKNIIDNGDKNSLILCDELCSGTEYNSAVSLVSSTILSLIKNKSNFIFTTHLHVLDEIPILKNIPELKIYHIEVDVDSGGKLIYNRLLKEGKCSSNYGIKIAQTIMNSDFIKEAIKVRNYLTNEDDKFITNKTSNYNKDVYMTKCKICGCKENLHTHHIVFQKQFEVENIPYNKNSKFNLLILCEDCHIKVHSNKIEIEEYKQTSEGVEFNYKYTSEQREKEEA